MPKTVTATRQLKATPERVFRAWTDPADVKRWFKPTRLIMEAKVDGLWHSEVEWQGKRWPHYGRFIRLERPRLFEQTLAATTIPNPDLPSDGRRDVRSRRRRR